jgi:hypothetical protein
VSYQEFSGTDTPDYQETVNPLVALLKSQGTPVS